jgi:hypothetical protein
VNEGLIFSMIALLLMAVFWLTIRRRKEAHPQRTANANHLAEVVRSAEIANNGFFRSLELVQKNLEGLIARAETVEQRLRSLMLHPGIEKREQYTAAALLLAEGHEVERVSSMLGLPEGQVHLIRELQQVSGKERRAGRAKKSDGSSVREPVGQSKVAASREKNAARPILLVDVLKNVAAEEPLEEQASERFKSLTV